MSVEVDQWIADAESQLHGLPEYPVVQRSMRLLDMMAANAVAIEPTFFDAPDERDENITADKFLVVSKPGLIASGSQHSAADIARQINGLAVVAHPVDLGTPSLMMLPDYSPDSPVHNANLLLHELMHIDETRAGLRKTGLQGDEIKQDRGKRERRAYGHNTELLELADGSDFDAYVSNWPGAFLVSNSVFGPKINLDFRDEVCPEPPKETMIHDLWNENGDGEHRLLRSIVRSAVREQVAAGLPEDMLDSLAGKMH